MTATPSYLLCATDFTPRAMQAATVAAKLAIRGVQSLRLVHASDAIGASARAALRRKIDAEAARLVRLGAVVEPVLLEGGNPADSLLQQIKAAPPALVVLASEAKGPIDRWALGSFAERIAESSPVPTLMVRNAAAFESWDWSKDRLKVLLALDRATSSNGVLRWAKQFKAAGPCDLISCHVNWRIPTPAEAEVAPGSPRNPPSLQTRLERDVRKQVRDQLGDESPTVIVRPYFGDPGPCLVELAAETGAQLVVVGAHQRRGLGRLVRFSVSRELLHRSATNVVCVPVDAKFDPREAHIPDYRRVLVATDFSELGNAAIPFAYAACAIGGCVKLVHVVRSRRPKARGGPDLRDELRALVPAEAGARCQTPEVEVLESSDVAAAICDEAARFGADLVCLASHGLGASRAFHGSVAKAVLKKIRRPLLVVRRPEE